ncbi:MAG: hypothetical protein KDB53_08045, partial [Planctomycetes bacterium]|nr:hypothetical protein [Planctomycetota bacterium]
RLVLPGALAVLAPAYLLFRRWQFGAFANYYAGHTRTFNFEILQRMLGDLVPTFDQLIGGHFHLRPPGFLSGMPAWTTWWLLLLLGLWMLKRPCLRFKILALGFGLYLVGVAPILRFYHEASGFDASRLFYLPALPAALLCALPLPWLKSRLWLLRAPAMVFVVLLGLSWSFAIVAQVRSQLAAAALIERVREDLSAVARNQSEPSAWLVEGLPIEIDRVPLYGTFMGYAFRDTFTPEPLQVRSLLSMELLLRDDALYRNPLPIRILRWTDDDRGGRLEARTGLLPAPRDHRPVIVPQPAGRTPIEGGLAPRDARALHIALDRVTDRAFHLELILHEGAAEPFRLVWDWNPVHGQTRELIASIHRRADWVTRGIARELEILVSGDDPPRVLSVTPTLEIPRIEALSPADDVEISLDAPAPHLRFRDQQAHSWYRIRLFIQPQTLTWTLPRDRFDTGPDGELSITLDTPGFFPGEIPVYWNELRPGGQSDLLATQGVDRLPLSWMIEGLRGDYRPEAPAQAESQVANFWITR